MKIIDMNVSVGGRDSAGKLMDYGYLMQLMEDYHLDHIVCYHQHARLDPKDGNSKMADLAVRSNGKIRVCAVLDPILGADNLPGSGTLVERLQQFQPVCLRVFPEDVRIPFHPMYWEEILEAANALALPLIVDYNYPAEFFCNLPAAAIQYPQIKFIVLRQGCCNGRVIFPLLQKLNNVYFTTERMLDNLQIEEIEERFGCDRLLFGSGYPERPHAGAMGLVIYANITEESREKILHKNWEVMTK